MTDPYKLDRQSLADSIRYFVNKTGCSDFVLPDLIDGKTLAFGSPEFIGGLVAPAKTADHLIADLCTAERERNRARNDCDRPRTEYWADQVERCERAIARK